MAFIGNQPRWRSGTFTPQSADPTNPVDGMTFISDGTSREKGLWRYDQASTSWVKVGSGANTDVIYIDDNFQSGVSSWVTYADAAGTVPVDGIGGSPNITFASSTSTPLRGTAEGLLTKDAANRQGQGISRAFTIDAADRAKLLTIKFDYATSTNFVDNDIRVYIYDVTNAAIIRVVPEDIKATSLSGTFLGTFQTASNSSSYRVILHIASTNASAYTLEVDNFSIRPVNSANSSIVSTQVSRSTSQSIANSTDTTIIFDAKTHDTTNMYNTSTGAFTIPESGYYSIDVAIEFASTSGSGYRQVYIGTVANSATGTIYADTYSPGAASGVGTRCIINCVQYIPKGTVLYVNTFQNSGGALNINGGGISPTLGRTSAAFTKIPSPVNSDFSSGNLIAFRGTNSAGTTLAANTDVLIPFTTEYDSTGSWSADTYTVPESGKFAVMAATRLTAPSTTISGANGNNIQMLLFKNNILNSTLAYTPISTTSSVTYGLSGSTVLDLVKGDTLRIYVRQDTGASRTLTASSTVNHLSIFKVPTVGASGNAGEKVIMQATQNSGQTINTTRTKVVYNTLVNDTHAAYNTSTGNFTAPVSGYYHINASVYWQSRTYTNNENYLMINLTNSVGNEIKAQQMFMATGTNSVNQNISADIYLAKGEIVNIVGISQGSSNSLVPNGVYNWLSIHLI